MIIDPHYGGPPGNANGGVVAGLLGGDGPAEVTIRKPVPVGVELRIDDERLLDGDGTVLAERADPAEPLDFAPPRVDVEAARIAGAATPLADGHPFPTCFGCGPDHPAGLHCLSGPAGDGVWAVAYTPPDEQAITAWAALDCPSSAPHAPQGFGGPIVLGRIAGVLHRRPAAGEPHVVVSWAIGSEGRRRYSHSAILTAGGEPCALARATWVQLGG